jgi:glycosyltransferase involved in cell wall biosynthesis
LQSGIPIVASDLPSVREIVDESQAFLCEPGNVASLAHQLARIRQEPEEAAKRAASAKVLAASYTWSARVERIRAWVDALPAWPERERQAALLARRDLLLVTQALDEQDQVLSFFVDWVRGLATKGFLIRAICWKKGQVLRLPANVVVTQAPAGAFRRSWFLVKLSWQQRAWVKAAFVHMLAPVVVALGAWWRMLGIRVSLWYTHGSVPWTLRVANWFATDIFTATEDSCRLATAKKHVLGHGINLEAFLVGTETREPMLLTVGRIAPRKDQLALVRLAEELQKEMGMRPWRIIIVGRPALPSDRAYEQEVRLAIERAGLTDRVLLVGEKKGPELLALYQRAALFVNPSRTGSLDKVVLEALACGTPALVVGTSYDGFAGVQRVDDVAIAAGVQRAVAALERPQAMPEARHGVHERANLDGLIDRLGARMMA